MSKTDIHHYICKAFDDFLARAVEKTGPQNWESLQGDLVIWAGGIDARVVFDGLLSILESESRFQYQELAGFVLTCAKIPCPLGLAEFMDRAFVLWNVSAGTVPRYAAQIYGREAVLDYVRSDAVALHKGRKEAIRYILGEVGANG